MSEKIEINKIYNIDAIKLLEKLSDNLIDLAIIDPPYNLKKADWDTFINEKEFFKFTFNWIDKLIPKLKQNASIYIFNTPYNSSYILHYLVNKGLIFQNWITWDKRDGEGCAKYKYTTRQETILFFTKNKEHIFNYEDIRIPYDYQPRTKYGILKNGKRWYPNSTGKLCGDVWHITSARHKNKLNGKTIIMDHITQKPMDMIERIIKVSSNENNLILDCFIGSGTTAIACKNLKRNYIGCDINKNYIDIANKKINEINKQNKL